jgi:hypothetical protein
MGDWFPAFRRVSVRTPGPEALCGFVVLTTIIETFLYNGPISFPRSLLYPPEPDRVTQNTKQHVPTKCRNQRMILHSVVTPEDSIFHTSLSDSKDTNKM